MIDASAGSVPAPPRVIVIGGGVSGLAVAWNVRRGLEEAGVRHELAILEAGVRAGGKILTERRDGRLVETGPNGFLDNEPATLRLCSALGLGDEILPADPSAEKRFLYFRGGLHPLPGSPGAFLRSPLLPLRSRLRVVFELWARKRPDREETVHEWVTRRLGRRVADTLIDAMVSGVYAGDVKALSLRAAFPRIAEMEERYGGLLRAQKAIARERKKRGEGMGPMGSPRGRLTSFRDGMDSLVRVLAERLESALRTGVAVDRIDRAEGGRCRVVTAGGARDGGLAAGGETADAVVVAVPAPSASRLLRTVAPVAAEALAEIPYASVTVVALGFRREEVGHPLDGFGFLAPRCSGMRTLGARFASTAFPGRAPEGQVLLEALAGGATDPEAVALPDDRLLDIVLDDLRGPLDLRASPSFTAVFRHARAIPQYTVGHEERVARAEADVAASSGLYLTGNALHGIAMNKCVAEAERIAAEVVGFLSRRRRSSG